MLDPQPLGAAAQPLGEAQGVGRADHAAQDGELLAAVAGEDVLVADRLEHEAGELGQHAVAAQVAVGVVDRLEVVEVEEEQGERAPVA